MGINQYAVIFLTALLVVGCGSDKGSGVGPTGSAIQIQPASVTYQSYFGSLGGGSGFQIPEFVTVTVLNSSGNPVKGAVVSMFNDATAITGVDSMQSSDKNGTFGTFQPNPYVAKTDDFGNVYLYVYAFGGTNLGDNSYDFKAFSGGAFTPMTLKLTCIDSDTSTPLTCN